MMAQGAVWMLGWVFGLACGIAVAWFRSTMERPEYRLGDPVLVRVGTMWLRGELLKVEQSTSGNSDYATCTVGLGAGQDVATWAKNIRPATKPVESPRRDPETYRG